SASLVGRREQAQRHVDDIGLHLLDAGERPTASEGVLVEVLEEGRPPHLRHVVARLEVEERCLAALPVDVVDLHGSQFLEHGLAGYSSLGQRLTCHGLRSSSGTSRTQELSQRFWTPIYSSSMTDTSS